MRNFDLNTGGIMGGTVGAVLAVVIVVGILPTTRRPIGWIALGIFGGILLGNVVWGRVFGRKS